MILGGIYMMADNQAVHLINLNSLNSVKNYSDLLFD